MARKLLYPLGENNPHVELERRADLSAYREQIQHAARSHEWQFVVKYADSPDGQLQSTKESAGKGWMHAGAHGAILYQETK